MNILRSIKDFLTSVPDLDMFEQQPLAPKPPPRYWRHVANNHPAPRGHQPPWRGPSAATMRNYSTSSSCIINFDDHPEDYVYVDERGYEYRGTGR